MFDKLLRLSAPLLLLLSAASAQASSGSIVGRVTVVSVASALTVINKTMGTRQCLKSNGEGFYQAALLLPGVYRVEVEAPGLKRFIRDNVEIPIDDRVEVNSNHNTTLASLSANVANPCRQSASCQCHRR